LDLSDNKISNMGAIALAEALHSNKTLAELNLNHNRIGEGTARQAVELHPTSDGLVMFEGLAQ
jgi:Ran GTPase-activating protein (RanGAP) involved in mRNA processing and transport